MADVNPAAELSYETAPVFREEHAEGRITRVVEQQAAKLPSGAFLLGSLGAMAAALALEIAGKKRASRFIGLWPAPLLSMGIYVKVVKTLGAR